MQQKVDLSQRKQWGRNQWNSICLAKIVHFDVVNRKRTERMVPPTIVHGRAYGENLNPGTLRRYCTKGKDKSSVRVSYGSGYGDPRPKYILCTDTRLSAEEALKLYQKRWPVEVDNLNLKEVLGLGDFRLQSFEAIQKWFAVVTLAINYLQYTAMLAYRPKQTASFFGGMQTSTSTSASG